MIASRNGTTSHSACCSNASSSVVQDDRRDPDQRPGRQGPARRSATAIRAAFTAAGGSARHGAAATCSRNCRPSWRASCSAIFDAITACVSSRLSKSPRDSDASTQSSRRARLRRARRVVEQRQLAERDAGFDLARSGRFRVRPAGRSARCPLMIDVQRLALLALVEDDLALQVAALVQQAVDDAQLERDSVANSDSFRSVDTRRLSSAFLLNSISIECAPGHPAPVASARIFTAQTRDPDSLQRPAGSEARWARAPACCRVACAHVPWC